MIQVLQVFVARIVVVLALLLGPLGPGRGRRAVLPLLGHGDADCEEQVVVEDVQALQVLDEDVARGKLAGGSGLPADFSEF